MDGREWIERCAARLREQWPRVPSEQLDEVAQQILRESERERADPEYAASRWLSQGIPRVDSVNGR